MVVAMVMTALNNILGLGNRGDHPMDVLLMAAWGRARSAGSTKYACYAVEKSSSLGKRLGLQTRCGYYEDVPAWRDALPARPRPGLRSRHQAFHQEMISEASSSSKLKAAVPAKRPIVEEEVQTDETMEHMNETKDEID